jgi:excisionase family DNA binding protein
MARFTLDQDDLDAIRAIVRAEIAEAAARADQAPSAWMDDEEAAKLLGFERSYLRTAVRTYSIPHSRIGKAYRFRRSDLEAWLAARDGR